MKKYKRFALGAAFASQHPELLHSIEDHPLRVRVPGAQPIEQSTYRKPGTDYVFILFSGAVRAWFDEHFEEGDTFLVDVELEDDEEPVLTLDLPVTGAQGLQSTCEVIPVRPDWTDPRGLLGFHNQLLGTYVMTPTLRLMLRAQEEVTLAKREERKPLPYFLILDEMNLARVEHYFSDFLSAMESEKSIPLHDDPGIEEENGDDEPVPRRITIPTNLYVTGTVNVDETTYMFSPKVLDRAFTLEFNEVDLAGVRPLGEVDEDDDVDESPLSLEGFPGGLLGARKPGAKDWDALRRLEGGALCKALEDLNALLERDHRHFGYRVASEIARFVQLAHDQASRDTRTLWRALDLAILSKVLVKLHGTQQELHGVLEALREFCISGELPALQAPGASTGSLRDAREDLVQEVHARFPRSLAKLERMLQRLHQQGFTSFIE